MLALILPFTIDSPQRVEVHVKQLDVINALHPSELEEMVRRQDFVAFIHTFLNNHNRFKEATSIIAPLLCSILFKARDFYGLEWPLLIDALYLFAEFDPDHIQEYLAGCSNSNPRLPSLLNRYPRSAHVMMHAPRN